MSINHYAEISRYIYASLSTAVCATFVDSSTLPIASLNLPEAIFSGPIFVLNEDSGQYGSFPASATLHFLPLAPASCDRALCKFSLYEVFGETLKFSQSLQTIYFVDVSIQGARDALVALYNIGITAQFSALSTVFVVSATKIGPSLSFPSSSGVSAG